MNTRSFLSSLSISTKGGGETRVDGPSRNAPLAPLPRPKPGELFIGVPFPWSWIRHAGALPGTTLHVGAYLWREAARRKNGCVGLSVSAVAREFGLSRATVGRALAALESAGLVRVKRRPGAKALVTLLAAPSDTDMSVETCSDE